jgi:hypothetical protein
VVVDHNRSASVALMDELQAVEAPKPLIFWYFVPASIVMAALQTLGAKARQIAPILPIPRREVLRTMESSVDL